MQKLLNALLYSLREKCPNTVNLRIQSKYRKIRARKNSVFGHFSRSDTFLSKSSHIWSASYKGFFNSKLHIFEVVYLK